MSLAESTGEQVGGAQLLRLSPAQVAQLLRHAGSQRLSEDAVRADIAAGAPTNADGTMSLVAYGAWLVRELARRGAARV
ncbi:MAG: hypothetical protein ACOCXJ_08440 [Planctomycetota bacterium]